MLDTRPARCPLCGAATAATERKEKDVDGYQSNVRRLREELRRLRKDDAEAV